MVEEFTDRECLSPHICPEMFAYLPHVPISAGVEVNDWLRINHCFSSPLVNVSER